MQDLIVFVDENPESSRVHKRALSEMFNDEIEVLSIPPERNIPRMLQRVSGYGKNLVTLVLDEQLMTDGSADFYGTQFVSEYRKYDDKLPIYILTSHSKDMSKNIGSVEFVMAKDDVAEDDDRRSALAERMLRHIGHFSQICDQRVIRIRELLLKSLKADLSDDESEELSKLFIWKSGAALEGEFEIGVVLKKDLDEREEKIKKIERALKERGW